MDAAVLSLQRFLYESVHHIAFLSSRYQDIHVISRFRIRALIQSLVWSMTCDISHSAQVDFINYIHGHEAMFGLVSAP